MACEAPFKAGQIKVTYEAYSVIFAVFTDVALPRTFVASTTYSQSLTGSQVISGTPYSAKYLWTISSQVSAEDAENLMLMYRAFDDMRSLGATPVVSVEDRTFGATVTANAVITTPPSISRVGSLGNTYAVALGLTEVG